MFNTELHEQVAGLRLTRKVTPGGREHEPTTAFSSISSIAKTCGSDCPHCGDALANYDHAPKRPRRCLSLRQFHTVAHRSVTRHRSLTQLAGSAK